MTDAGVKRREEHAKLAASALSNIGVAFIVAGLVGPSITGHANLYTGLGSVLLGFGFHLAARGVLHYVGTDARRSEPGDS